MKILFDGHIHTPYCPHGSEDSLEAYVETCLHNGLQEMTFTEHAPLPDTFIDPTPDKDSAMKKEDLQKYFDDIDVLKKQYKDQIKINCGLEVDFIEGFEEETKSFLNTYGPLLDDSILSVHFLKNDGEFHCVDFSEEVFEDMITLYGSIDRIYEKYYETLKLSIVSDLGPYKPKRIGHMTLVQKFKRLFPPINSYKEEINIILHEIHKREYQLDYNGAGAVKPNCLEPYPPTSIVEMALDLKIPLVYGSDAHSIRGLMQGVSQFHNKTVLANSCLK